MEKNPSLPPRSSTVLPGEAGREMRCDEIPARLGIVPGSWLLFAGRCESQQPGSVSQGVDGFGLLNLPAG